MIIKTMTVGSYGCNCTIIGDEKTNQAIVIDPGDEAERILAVLAENELICKAILHTHAHIDHIGATGKLAESAEAPILLHKEDEFLYTGVEMQGRMLGLQIQAPPPVDKWFRDDDEVGWGIDQGAKVIHTPGHTPGSVSFHVEHPEQTILFTGDTLFQLSIGRTDLPGGNMDTLMKSIHGKLMTFADETLVIPGHGPATTIGRERVHNPFLNGSYA